MNKLYGSIQTELINPDLEAQVDLEVQSEPVLAEVTTDIYAAISSSPPAATVENTTLSPEARQFAYVVPTRLYTQIVPEKPSILAEERIFVYVPKVAYSTAGIAKFESTQFNIIDGEVSLKQSYLAEVLASNLLKPEVILVVTELPTAGLDNRIYLVPLNSTTCNGYVWNTLLQTWISLGSLELNLADYYTKNEALSLLANVKEDFELIKAEADENSLALTWTED